MVTLASIFVLMETLPCLPYGNCHLCLSPTTKIGRDYFNTNRSPRALLFLPCFPSVPWKNSNSSPRKWKEYSLFEKCIFSMRLSFLCFCFWEDLGGIETRIWDSCQMSLPQIWPSTGSVAAFTIGLNFSSSFSLLSAGLSLWTMIAGEGK